MKVVLKEQNECALGIHKCDIMASCSDTKESYSCNCDAGWEGEGLTSALEPVACTKVWLKNQIFMISSYL